jgi:pimeloyl-ACP methyl ester carboxylesterase
MLATRFRRVLPVASVVLAVVLGVQGASATLKAPGQRPAPPPQRPGSPPGAVGPGRGGAIGEVVFHPCGDRLPGARCGRIEVPADPSFPALGSITVGFARYPRRDRDEPSRGTIVAVEGGPGYSTIGSRSYYRRLFRPLMEHRSLLLMDLRGTGRSDAIDCPELQRWRPGSHSMSWIAAEAACGRQLGPMSSRYGSAFAADDLALLLDGLGIGKLDLYGDSYGTFFAQTFAVRHPDRVATLILDAAYPIEGTDPWWRDTNRAGVDAIRTACRRAPTCHGDPIVLLRRLAARLRDRPIRGTAPDADGRPFRTRVTAASINTLLSFAGYGPSVDRELVAAARAAMRARPDPRPLLRLLSENEWHWGAGNVHAYSQGLATATSCNDYPMLWDRFDPVPERKAAFDDAVAELRRTDPRAFDPLRAQEWARSNQTAYRSCLRWPVPDAYVPPFPDGGSYPDVPTLVLAGEFDSITSPEGARQVARNFPNGTYVEVPNSFHVTALGDRPHCVDRIVVRFVRTATTGDTSCLATDYPPVNVVQRFPRAAASVLGPVARRAAIVATGTVGDVIGRWWNMYGYEGVGLRGGTFSTVGLWSPTWRLRGVRWVRDVPVDGSAESNLANGRSRAHVTLGGGGIPASDLRIRWNAHRPFEAAHVTGTVGGRRVDLRVPAP